jgi:predicted amidohydrolase
MKVAVVQHDICFGDAPSTIARLRPRVAEAAASGAQLVVLTEMFGPGFSMDTGAVSEPEDGPSATFLAAAAVEHGVWVCGSAPIRVGSDAGSKPVNRFLLAGPHGGAVAYDKIHPFSYSGEHEHYGAGREVLHADVAGVRLTPFICYDLRFADLFWGEAPVTDCYVVVANWPASRRQHWQALLRARAIENQAYVVAANRVGEGGGLDYAGDSCVIDPLGETLVAASGSETILYADVDPDRVVAVRKKFPFLADRHP